MNCITLFFNHKIEVTACKPECSDRNQESFEPVKSLANQLRAIGDTALAPVRYLFNGQTVHLERKKGEVEGKPKYAAGHVVSFHTKTDSVYGRSITVYLRPDEKTWLRTVAAIILLIPGIFIALFTKLPAYLAAETREYNELAYKHFTPISMSVGEKEPLSTLIDIYCSIGSARSKNTLDQPVDVLTIYTKKDLSCDDTEANEKQARAEYIPREIFIMEPKKIIFIGLSVMTCRQLFVNQLLKDKWVRNYTETQDEALAAPLQQKSEYFVLKGG